MDIYTMINGFVEDYLPSSFWLIVFSTVCVIVVGTSGGFITRVWRVQFAVVRDISTSILTGILVILLWLLMIIFTVLPLMPLCLPLIIIRKLEEWLYTAQFNCERLDSDAVTWMLGTPENPSIINGVLIMEKEFSIEQLQRVTETKWINSKDSAGNIRYPNVQKYICGGLFNYYWRPEEHFNVKRHAFQWGEKVYSKEEFNDILNQVSKRPFLTEDKFSPWEEILINFEEDGVRKTCLFVRAHHALADGLSIVHFIMNHMSDDAALLPPVPKVPNALKIYMKTKGYFYMPLTCMKSFLMAFPSHDLHCTKASGKKNVSWSDPISLDLIKAIKKKLNVTVNDVLVGCLATNFHRYFKDNGKTVPSDIVVSLPFDTRFSIAEAEKFSNKFAVILFPMPTGNGEALDNVHLVHHRMNTLKVSAENHGMRTAMRCTNYSVPLWMAKYIHTFFASHSSMVLSNVPGPKLPFKMDGISVERMCFWPPAKDNIGMSVSLLSYQGKIWITFYCDNSLEATSSELLKGFPEVFYSLAEKVGIIDPESYE